MLGQVMRRAFKQLCTQSERPGPGWPDGADAVPRTPTVSLHAAQAALAGGRPQEAVGLCRELLREDPQDVDVLCCLATALRILGRTGEASMSLERAVRLAPLNAEVHYQLGVLERLRGCERAAERRFHLAVSHDPQHARALNNLGVLALGRTDNDEAALWFRRALARQPKLAAAHCNLGNVLRERGDLEGAVRHFRRALEVEPRLQEAHCNLALALWDGAHYEQAKATLQRVLQLHPAYALAWRNAGIVYQACGDYDTALAHFDRCLHLDPNDAHARFGRAQIQLARRDYERGWREYESRYAAINEPRGGPPVAALQPAALRGASVLVRGEQGIGDEIMFASCIPDLQREVGRCVIECTPKLAKLFGRSFPGAELRERSQTIMPSASRSTDFDYELPIGSLGLLYRKEIASFPEHGGYLEPDGQRRAYWRRRLEGLGSGLKVGISWRGGTVRTKARIRSLALLAWTPILRATSAQFIDLQYTDGREEVEHVQRTTGVTVHRWPEAIADYDETAALVAALDLVISVQTALIHLTGALGKPVWVLVPASPEWRYGASGERMDWYPSARLFRQQRLGQWGGVVTDVVRALGPLTTC